MEIFSRRLRKNTTRPLTVWIVGTEICPFLLIIPLFCATMMLGFCAYLFSKTAQLLSTVGCAVFVDGSIYILGDDEMEPKTKTNVSNKKLRSIKMKIALIVVCRVVLVIVICAFIIRVVIDYPHIPSAIYGLISLAIVVVCAIFGKVSMGIYANSRRTPYGKNILKSMIAKYKDMKKDNE